MRSRTGRQRRCGCLNRSLARCKPGWRLSWRQAIAHWRLPLRTTNSADSALASWSPSPTRCGAPARATSTYSALADLDLDERRLDDGGQDVAATYVDDDLVALLGARSEQRQSDSLLQGRRERPGGDFTQQRAVCALDLAVRTRDPTARGQQTPGDALGTRGLLCDERVLAPECVLLPANGPAGPSLHRSDVQAQLVTVQRVAHLGAQGIARTQATGQPVIRCRGLDQRVPESQRVVPARDQLVTVQRVAHLGTQGIARTQATGQPVIRCRGLDHRVPESQRVVPARDQ